MVTTDGATVPGVVLVEVAGADVEVKVGEVETQLSVDLEGTWVTLPVGGMVPD